MHQKPITNALTFEELRQKNIARQPLFKNKKGELVHPTGADTWTISDYYTALEGEAGEAGNIIKKIRRGDFTLEEAKVDLGKELADTLIYLDLLAAKCGIDLHAVTVGKFNEVSFKQKIDVMLDGSPQSYFDEENWLGEDEADLVSHFEAINAGFWNNPTLRINAFGSRTFGYDIVYCPAGDNREAEIRILTNKEDADAAEQEALALLKEQTS